MNPLAQKKHPSSCQGRPREFDEDAVLAAAAQAFWKNGYHATSIDDLCEATGLLRGSLYGAYGDKRGIFLAALDRYCEARVARLAKGLKTGPPGRKILRENLVYYFQSVSDLDLARACFITNTALELTPQDREVSLVIERTFRRMSALWSEAAVRAQNAGAFKSHFDEKTVGDYLYCIVQGLRVLGKIYKPDELSAVVDLAFRALE
jgi:TetR/AcrR family transcriptional regulator, transcriptional repressor for nem operon